MKKIFGKRKIESNELDVADRESFEAIGYGHLNHEDIRIVGDAADKARAEVLEVVPDLDEILANSVNDIDEDVSKVMYYDELPAYGDADDPLQEMQNEDYRVEKVSVLCSRFYLWRMNVSDAVRNMFRKKKVATKKARKESRAIVRKKVREATQVERQKLYNQFVNRLILLLINGLAVGGLLLAAMDYLLNAQIPERSPIVLGLLVVLTLYCTIYWLVTFKRNKGVEGVRGLASFALIICLIGIGVGGFDMYKNTANLNTYFSGERIVIKDKRKTADTLAGYITTWRHTPNYSLIRISDTAYYATVFNSKGESITQLVNDGDTSNDTVDQTTGESFETLKDIAICLRDSTAVIVTEDVIERRKDVDNLRYVELAYQWAAKGKANIERVSVVPDTIPKDAVPTDTMPGTEYAVIIKGLPKIKEFYSTVLGEVATADMLKSMMMAGDIELRFHLSLATGYIGVAAVISVDGEDNLLWFIDNYIEVYDWSLGGTDWYTYDFQDADKNEIMVQEAVFNATSMLEQYGLDSGLAYTDTDLFE